MRRPSKTPTKPFLGFCLLLFLSAEGVCAQPLKFVCEPPQGKRLELAGTEKQPMAAPVWIDDILQGIHPAVTVDGEILTVTWGGPGPNPVKGAAAKPTTYVFASAYRNDQSILATRVDRTGAEIFRFYFGSKKLLRLTSASSSTSADIAAPAVTAIQIADCRDQ